MIVENDCCELYESALAGEETARKRIIQELGAYAILPKPNPRIELNEKELPMSVKKPTLRQLAIEAGLFKPNDLKIFQMNGDELLEVLKPKFPGIDELDEAGVQDLIANVKKGGGKPASKDDDKPRGRQREEEPEEKPRGRRRESEPEEKKPAAKEDDKPRGRGRREEPPAEEEEKPRGRRREEPKDEPAKDEEKPRGRGRRSEPDDEPKDEEKPRGRGRGRGREEESEEAPPKRAAEKEAPSASQTDVMLEAVLKGLADLNGRLDEIQSEALASSAKVQKELEEQRTLIDEMHAGVDLVAFQDELPKKAKTLADILKAKG